MDKKKQIEELLKDNPKGLTIQDMVDRSGISRNTIMVILAKLFGEKRLGLRQIGNAKLHYWNYDKTKQKRKN